MGQTVLQHLTIKYYMLLKKQATYEDWMISSNNNIYVLKCYLNVFKIVPVKMEGVESFIDIAVLM